MHRSLLGLGLCAGLLLQLPATLASAQASPDVVMTHDGGMMRGTIVESVPDDHVTITLGNGESRTIEWSRVRFAGPESDRPSARAEPVPTPPPSSVSTSVPTPSPAYGGGDSDTVSVRVVTDQQNLSLHEVTGTATATAWTGQAMATIRAYSFDRLCGAPCTLELDRGSHHFALSQGGGEVPGQPMDILQDGTLHAQYVDRSALRVAGWITIIGGALAGSAIMLIPLATDGYTNTDTLLGAMIGGGVVLLVSEIVGMVMAFQGDSAELRFE